MCGRFTLRTSPDALSKLFQVMFADVFSPRFNIAPTQTILAVRQTGIHREPAWFHWGLVPSWAIDTKIAFSTINARGETLAEKLGQTSISFSLAPLKIPRKMIRKSCCKIQKNQPHQGLTSK